MADRADESLIDRIYEAAVIPEFLPAVIEHLARITDAALGSLVAFSGDVTRWTGTPAAETLLKDYIAVGNPALNSRVPRGIALRPVGFFTDYDLFTAEEIAADPFYQDFLRPRGYGWVAATEFAVPSGDRLIFSLERNLGRGNFERKFIDLLNDLRPHIGRAALVAARLDLQRARSMTQALEIVGLPAAVLKVGGGLYAANPHFEKLIPDVVRDHRERIMLIDKGADTKLADALRGLTGDAVQSVPLAAREGRTPMIFHVLPVRRSAHDIFAQGNNIVVVTAVDRHAVPAAEVLQGLFDLTPAESRVARAIAERQTLSAIAASLGVSRTTVRTQLKAVLSKTGLRRQIDLAHLLAGVQLPV